MIFERVDTEQIAVLSMATPGNRVNVVDLTLFRELAALVADIALDDSIAGIVLISGKDGHFGVGADLDWVDELSRSQHGRQNLEEIHAVMAKLYWSSKPLVVAIDGLALGGALELALASRSILATPESAFGFPEVRLGLMPGGGGTVLLPRRVHPAVAIDMLTTGRQIDSTRALAVGLISQIADREDLTRTAVATARDHSKEASRSWHKSGDFTQALEQLEPEGDLARDRIIQSVVFSVGRGLEESLSEERRLFFEQIGTLEARSGIHLFRAERAIKRLVGLPQKSISRLGVIGAGQMGAGIAATAALLGADVVVRDVDTEALARARGVLTNTIARHSSSTLPALGTWVEGVGWDAYADVDAVIEAVYESEKLKAEVLEKLSESVPAGSLIATNTSALSITGLAAAVKRPDRFLGIHFFSPVDRMRLVELVPHPGTSGSALRRALDLGRQMRKVPVVVADRPGFFTSRVYTRWLVEGMRLLLEGSAPDAIDVAATTAGFAAGPMVAIDEASIDLVLEASIEQVASRIMSTRLPLDPIVAALTTLAASGLNGRRAGVGFYRYDERGRRTGPNTSIQTFLGISSPGPAEDEIIDRLILAFVSESLLAWDDGVLCHPDDGDFAAVAGIGFPRRLGGPFHYVDQVGPKAVIAGVSRLGGSFPTGITLPQMAGTGTKFVSTVRSSLPEPRPPGE